jgi:pimeloyl-ACP methyl ester carboxylesterase
VFGRGDECGETTVTDRDRRAEQFRATEGGIIDRYLPGAREHCITWSGSSIRVVDAGSGPPVVFLHGITGTLTNFASLAADLTTTNRCLLLDLPGHGLSGRLDLAGRSPRGALVDAIGTVLDELSPGVPVVLVGNSLGGMTALYLAADRPRAVASIAVLGEPAYAFPGARARLPLSIIGLPVLGRLTLAVPPPPLPLYRRTIRRGFGDRALARIDPDVLDANRLSVWAAGGARSVAGLMRALMGRRGEAAAGVPLTDEDFGRIQVPIWFLWGDQDPFMSPEAGRVFVERFEHAALDIVPGAHVPWFDHAGLANTRLRSLIDDT